MTRSLVRRLATVSGALGLAIAGAGTASAATATNPTVAHLPAVLHAPRAGLPMWSLHHQHCGLLGEVLHAAGGLVYSVLHLLG